MTTIVQHHEDPRYGRECAMHGALNDLSIPNTSVETLAHEPIVVPTCIRTPQRTDHWLPGFAAPTERAGKSTDWDDARPALPLRTARRSGEYRPCQNIERIAVPCHPRVSTKYRPIPENPFTQRIDADQESRGLTRLCSVLWNSRPGAGLKTRSRASGLTQVSGF